MADPDESRVIHLRRVFTFLDKYVEGFISDGVSHVRARVLEAIPDFDLCKLLFVVSRKHEEAMQELGVKLIDRYIRQEGCLNEISIDVQKLSNIAKFRDSLFDFFSVRSIQQSGSCEQQTDRVGRPDTVGKGNIAARSVHGLTKELNVLKKEVEERDKTLSYLEKLLKQVMFQTSEVDNGWAGEFFQDKPGYDINNEEKIKADSVKRKLRMHAAKVLNLMSCVSSYSNNTRGSLISYYVTALSF